MNEIIKEALTLLELSKENHTSCGGCSHFENEDIDGYGWCYLHQLETKCDSSCDKEIKKTE